MFMKGFILQTNTHYVFDMTRASKERGEATAIFFTVSAINMYGASHAISVIYACKYAYNSICL